jgi:SSS family solute:Na+ symporter
MIIGFWYWCTDQYIVQRVLSAKDQKEARRGTILAAYFKLLPVFIFLVPGMIAYALAQKVLLDIPLTAEGTPNADSACSVMGSQLLPIGVKGFVVCGLLAALMSSLASLFNSSAALFVGDFYKKMRPNASEKHLVAVGRIATATVVILGIIWIPVMKGMGNVLYRYLQNVQGLLAPAIAAAFLMGAFSKRATSWGGFSGLVIGFALGVFRLVLDVFKERLTEGTFLYWVADVNWLHYCEFLFVICLLVTIVVSLMTRPPSKEQLRYTYYAATPEEKAATRANWNKWDVIHTLIILGVIVAFYIYFW